MVAEGDVVDPVAGKGRVQEVDVGATDMDALATALEATPSEIVGLVADARGPNPRPDA